MTKSPKITVVGSGYVGMSLAVLLSQNNIVTILEIDACKVDLVNNKKSTILDKEIDTFFSEKELNLSSTLDKNIAYSDADFIIVATPTNYNTETNRFDTNSVDEVVSDALNFNKEALIIIKSTIPVGHTKLLQDKFNTERIIFSPEFLREGQALKDNLYPSRIIIGSLCERGKNFGRLLQESAEKKNYKYIIY